MIKLIKTCCAALAISLTAVSAAGAAPAVNVKGDIHPITAEQIGALNNIKWEDIEGKEGLDRSLKTGEKTDRHKKTIYDSKAFVIKINGKETVYVADKAAAEEVVKGLSASYLSPGAELESVAFAEEISYEEKDTVSEKAAENDKNVMPTYICDTDEAVRYILSGTDVPVVYTVKGGDTLWEVAKANNISVYELEAMNPGVSQNLAVGSTLNLYQKNPLVHVTVTEKVRSVETVPYNVKYTYSNNLYKGQVQVSKAGQAGSKEVTSKVTKQDGVEISREILSENVTSQPVTQIAVAGTKAVPVPSGNGTGQLQWPVGTIQISSPYGSRGGGFHRGVDLRAPRGTAIMAADSGVVTFAGPYSTYGNLVVVNHGGGLTTKYAHCNTIGVYVGQSVQKGDVIATVGRTGNATGNHLHFEVCINGVAKNPLNYL